MIVFIHLPKTGGSTLRSILRRQVEPAAYLGLNYFKRPEECLDRLRQAGSPSGGGIRAVAAHVPFGVCASLVPDARYITVLRDPVERVLSAYYYSGRRRGFGVPLEEQLSQGDAADNHQTRMLCGGDRQPGGCTEEMLEWATSSLRRRFAAAGTTERFDEFVTLLRLSLGWRNVLYTPLRVTEGRPHANELPDGLRQQIESANRLDRKLHSLANRMLDEAIEAHGPIFGTELEALRRANACYADMLTGAAMDRTSPPSVDGTGPVETRATILLAETDRDRDQHSSLNQKRLRRQARKGSVSRPERGSLS